MKKMLFAAMLLCAALPAAQAQSTVSTNKSEQYVPQLGGIMTAAQLQHLKLWSAGAARNWPLAAYELRQLQQSLAEAAILYSRIPVSNISTLASSIDAIAAAVEMKDGTMFVQEFDKLTAGCNACHQSMDRAFIVIRTPTEQPFSNQVFRSK
jgi:hypothetical protein